MIATAPRPRWRRPAAALLALALVAPACGDDDDGSTPEAVTSTTAESTTTTTEPTTTTTTEAPRQLTEEQLLGVLLQAEDVPHHLVVDDRPMPPGVQTTDPPACGEALSGDGPGEVRATTMFVEPDGFLAFESLAEHTPGEPEDLDAARAAIAGPCAEGAFYVTTEGIETFQRTTPLGDLDVGDDAFAARWDIAYELEGHDVEVRAYMVYFRRGDVTIQVQAMTGTAPTAGVTGADVSLEEAERLARRMDERLAAL